MTKTTNSTSARRTKIEAVITAAIDTALSLSATTPPEDLDFSSIHVGIEQGQVSEREIDELFVTGDVTSIITADGVVSAEKYNITILYTQGKDTIGTGSWDFYSDILAPLHLLGTALPFQHRWSPAGGNVGDEEYFTDPDMTFIMSCPKPVGGASSEKIKLTYSIFTPAVAAPAIVA